MSRSFRAQQGGQHGVAPRILIVDDDAELARRIELQLRDLGYDVVGTAASGEEAIARAAALQPDLLLMDIVLSGALDGIEAASIIKQRCDAPVVYLTGHADDAILARANITEPYAYILKPCQPRELHAAITLALYRSRAERELRLAALSARSFASIVDAVISIDLDGRILLANPAARTMLEYPDDRSIGRMWHDVIHLHGVSGNDVVAGLFDEAIRTSAVLIRDDDTWLVAPSGRRIPVNLRISPLADEHDMLGVTLVIRDISKRKQVEAALDYRLRFDELVAGLAAGFINLPPERIDEGIDEALAAVGRFVGVDRGFILRLFDDVAEYAHEWCNEHVSSVRHIFTRFSLSSMPWVFERLKNNDVVHIIDPAELPPEAEGERRALAAGGVRSLVAVPLVSEGGRLIGVAGYASLSAPHQWDQDGISLLRIFGGMLRNVFDRQYTETERARLMALLEAAPDIVGMADKDGYLLYLNRAGRLLIGVAADENMRATPIVRFHPPEIARHIMETALPAAVRDGLWHGETIFLAADGTEIHTSQAILAHKSPKGEVEYYSTIARDITERKQAEELRNRFGRVLDNVSDEIYAFDAETLRFVEVNRGALRNLGYTMDEIRGLTPLDLKPDFTPESFAQQLQPLRSGTKKTVLFQTRHRRKDGTFYPVEVRLQLAAGESPPVFVAIILDITERLQTERELQAYREHLEELVMARTTELEAVNKELEAFSYSVSHDLRAPLRSINGFSRTLLEDYAERLDDEGRDCLDRVTRASRRMGELIDDILTLSRISRQELGHESVDLSAVARQHLRDLGRADRRPDVEIVIAPDLNAEGDPRLLRVLMENLLNNAWKFTSKTPRARIEVGWQTQNNQAVFYIRDNGAGFDMRYADKLFGAFQRLHTDTEFEGTGVGLAIVQRVIHRHGGHVWAYAEEGKGATFYFTLPRMRPAVGMAQA